MATVWTGRRGTSNLLATRIHTFPLKIFTAFVGINVSQIQQARLPGGEMADDASQTVLSKQSGADGEREDLGILGSGGACRVGVLDSHGEGRAPGAQHLDETRDPGPNGETVAQLGVIQLEAGPRFSGAGCRSLRGHGAPAPLATPPGLPKRPLSPP